MTARIVRWIATLGLALAACAPDLETGPGSEQPGHSELDGIAVRLLVDVARGEVHIVTPTQGASGGDGPSLAILGSNEIGITTTNLVRSSPVNGKVQVTFDVAIRNRLTSASLVPSSFPGTTAAPGLLLFPFKVSSVVGGTAAQVVAGQEWNGDGSAGSGAPRNFFNDFGCPVTGGTSDCYRWEQFASPLGPGETSAAQQVGFTVNKAVQSFVVSLVLAADIQNDLPAVAGIAVTPPAYTMADGFPAGFSAVAYDANNNPLTWATLTWRTPDVSAIAFQSGGSLVPAITGSSVIVHGRKVGLVSFTVSSGGITVSVPVDIQVNTVALVQLSTPDSSITIGEQLQGDARVKDHSGQIIPLDPTWSTSDGNVLTVDQTGLIVAVGVGTATITATAGAASGAVTITVGPGTGVVTGTVSSPQLGVFANATVELVSVNPYIGVRVQADGSGFYTFTNVPAGDIIVSLITQPSGCNDPGSKVFTLAPGGDMVADFSVDCPVPGTVSGTATSPQLGGLPFYPIDLLVTATNAHLSTTTDVYGNYSFSDVPAGEVTVSLEQILDCNYPAAQTITVPANGNAVADFDLDCSGAAPAPFAGTVESPEVGPLPSVTVQLLNQGIVMDVATSDKFGNVNFGNVTPGIYDLVLTGLPLSCVDPGGQVIIYPIIGNSVVFIVHCG